MPATITPKQFADKWAKINLKERTIAQSHFLDVCALVGQRPPLLADPKGEFFTFEAEADKGEGERGWADAWYKGHFAWEYKSPNKNLEAAYQQLLRYKDSLGNPPLLITSDAHIIEIHTNFTNTVKEKHKVTLPDIREGDGVDVLRRVFFAPETFLPKQTQEQVTRATANEFVAAADALRRYEKAGQTSLTSEQLAHILIRLLFCLFAEDIHLLPSEVFTKLVSHDISQRQFEQSLRLLFAAMRDGGMYGVDAIPYFDGGLFDDDLAPENMPSDVRLALRRAAGHDWSSIDPSIFGAIFERIIDEAKRAQLGAHYTSKDDILLVIEPVLMQPLRRRWMEVKPQAEGFYRLGENKQAAALLQGFADEIAALRVLDPACGSGAFLYLALRQLLDLQKEVISLPAKYGAAPLPLSVGPQQIYGIEINHYAHQLAQATVWIGYLQWRFGNGFADLSEPILRPLRQIENKDAIIDLSHQPPTEPAWPAADVIIGNPPFLGDKKMRGELGHPYVEALRKLYAARIPGQSDLCCYWFEKARAQIAAGQAKRAGLLATQGIRGGANRTVLDRVVESGGIFWAESDRNWIQDGATVHVSMVGFDDGLETSRQLDNKTVTNVNADLTSGCDLTRAKNLGENWGLAFIGTQKGGDFDIPDRLAQAMLADKSNLGASPNREVVRPWVNALDLTGRPRRMWIIDFGNDSTEEQAAAYKAPYKYVVENVKDVRLAVNSEERTAAQWWLFQRPRPELRAALKGMRRYLITPRVSKHRMFIWMPTEVVPDSATVAVAREDDYFFGVLHSRVHELWALGTGTQLREAESGFRYTPTTTFETFPFPWPPGKEPVHDPRVQAIAQAAKELNELRSGWLNPPQAEVGVTIGEKMLARRTLTNLYNALADYRARFKGRQRLLDEWRKACGGLIDLSDMERLDYLHGKLDQAVLDAYGWPHSLSDEQILERLLALNLARAAQGRVTRNED